MIAPRWSRIRAIFEEACDRDGADREQYLEEQCRDDAELRAQVERLLELDHAADARSDRRSDGVRRIGRYALGSILGEGGMGVVYRAEQEHPRRSVALKVLRAPVAGSSLRERFHREATLLGRLDHPGIARIYDADTAETEQGSVLYFAMELVEGSTIVEHVRRGELSLEKRVELIAKVADAIHHAHEKGIVHRDLKPANVLVDERAEPRIVDFGVAVALLDDGERATRTGQIIGTLEYMSPEQLTGDPDAIDTRSDIYSLGLLAYEILADTPAFEPTPLHGPAARERLEREPTRLGLVRKELRGDLETIVGKAACRDRDQRYASAAEFAADLRRYLRGEPIVARPASGLYHLRMFAKRNKGLVVATVFAAIGLGVLGWTLAAARESGRREQELSIAFGQMFDTLRKALKEVQQGTPVEEVVDRLSRARHELAYERPQTQIQVLVSWANFCESFHLYERSSAFFRDALTLSLELRGAEDERTRYLAVRLSNPLFQSGQYEAFEHHSREWFERFRDALGPDHDDTLRFRSDLAMAYRARGDLEGAATELEQLIADRERIHGEFHPDIERDRLNLAKIDLRLERPNRALELARRTRSANAKATEVGNSLTVEADLVAAIACLELDRVDDAANHLATARTDSERDRDKNDRNRLELRYLECRVLIARARPDEARRELTRLIHDATTALGEANPTVERYRRLLGKIEGVDP
ncbi:MAG: protein kinase [Planctomycetes bacterium]|nr:protein kinase [Planctomycetota bacterium]